MAADLPEDDGDGRRKVVVFALGEMCSEVQLKFDSQLDCNGKESIEDRGLNSALEKGKGKAKCAKRKA